MAVGGLILAAPASSSGKTLVMAGLLRHLRRRGTRVATAKAGPDFIDPSFHAAASGAPCVNLDVWAMQRATLAGLVRDLEASAEIVLCEGVMGLFDGTGVDGETGSTAELAQITGWPVVLIVDARGQGASIAALLRGFTSHRPGLSLAGVICNRVSGERHRAFLSGAVARHLPDLAVLGAMIADPALSLPSRHLGLVPAGEIGEIDAIIDRAAAQVGTSLDIDRMLRLARSSQFGSEAATVPVPPLGRRIAVARDAAFCFTYPTTLNGWRREGAEITFFSPLEDEPPDPSADAIYLPGGYPELWAGRLAAGANFFAGLRRAAAAGRPIYGECGGYMVLGDALIDADGRTQPMAGLLPLVTSFADRRLSLGYRSARLLADGPFGQAGAHFRGHEFHYVTVIREGASVREDRVGRLWSMTDTAGIDLGAGGLRRGSVFGSFIHLIDASATEDCATALLQPRAARSRRPAIHTQ